MLWEQGEGLVPWVTVVAEAGLAGKGTPSHLGIENVQPWPRQGDPTP